MRPKVLLVDDEPDNRRFLGEVLESRGFDAACAADAAQALRAVRRSAPALILSDVAMPGLSGTEMVMKLKADPRTARIPVILMSGARKEDRDRADGIELGADDYLLKPFTPRLMIAKINGVLRRCALPEESGEVLTDQGLSLDVQSRIVEVHRGRLALTRKEFDLLAAFLRRRGKTLRHTFLLETVWGYDPALYSDPHTVETHVSSLRRKLGPRLGKMIANVPGIGYRFDGR